MLLLKRIHQQFNVNENLYIIKKMSENIRLGEDNAKDTVG
jgi:hypothetical protein